MEHQNRQMEGQQVNVDGESVERMWFNATTRSSDVQRICNFALPAA